MLEVQDALEENVAANTCPFEFDPQQNVPVPLIAQLCVCRQVRQQQHCDVMSTLQLCRKIRVHKKHQTIEIAHRHRDALMHLCQQSLRIQGSMRHMFGFTDCKARVAAGAEITTSAAHRLPHPLLLRRPAAVDIGERNSKPSTRQI